jgi:hypothetical protein
MKSFGILILTILFIFQTGYAQKSNRVIQGRLLDSLTHEALPYATVRLETSDNAKPQVILTDDKGDFRFETALKSNLTLRFDYMGYQKKALTVEMKRVL